jgi:ribosomal-protein-alanine N-acetyltransferase
VNPVNRLPLETKRLVLRELEDSDFDAVHAYASDPIVVQFMPWGPNSEAETSDFLARAKDLANDHPRLSYELAVTLRAGGALLGAMGLHRENADSLEAMLGYCFAQPAWGYGYASEAAEAIVRFGFTGLDLESIWAGCDADNLGSINVLQKLGMSLQSRHRDDNDDAASSHESLMFRIRATEWMDRHGPAA